MDGNAWCRFTFLKSYALLSTSLLSYELLGIDGMKMNPQPYPLFDKNACQKGARPGDQSHDAAAAQGAEETDGGRAPGSRRGGGGGGGGG